MLHLHHAHQICGIVAHNRDQSMWTIAGRAIEIAAPSLVEASEQEESLRILDSTNTKGGQWLRDVVSKLRKGWDQQRARHQQIRSPISDSNDTDTNKKPQFRSHLATEATRTPQSRSRALSSYSTASEPRSMDVEQSPLASRNKMEALSSADFRCHDRPYRNWWQPANRLNAGSAARFRGDLSDVREHVSQQPPHHMMR